MNTDGFKTLAGDRWPENFLRGRRDKFNLESLPHAGVNHGDTKTRLKAQLNAFSRVSVVN
jgi:hypothetical protein